MTKLVHTLLFLVSSANKDDIEYFEKNIDEMVDICKIERVKNDPDKRYFIVLLCGGSIYEEHFKYMNPEIIAYDLIDRSHQKNDIQYHIVKNDLDVI